MPYTILGDLQTLILSNNVKCNNPCCILTVDNIVELMGNMELEGYEGGTALATLPASMRPVEPLFVQTVLETEGSITSKMIKVSTDGEMSIDEEVQNGVLYTNGLVFNVCGQYYNEQIGNNFPQGTSPLTAR